MKEKVLITGASGFLGYHLILSALENNLEVFAAVRSNSNVKHLEHLPLNFITLDYKNTASLKQAFNEHRFQHVIHAAGITKANSLSDYDLVNADFTNNLALAAETLKNDFQRFVLISSLAAIGPEKGIENIITEDKIPAPVTAYGKSKLKAENCLKKIEISSTILRPTAIYGPRERDLFLISNYLNKGFEPYIGKAPQKLSFVYAKDVADVAVNALRLNNANGAYNITDGFDYNKYDFADIIKNYLGKKTLKIYLPVSLVKLILFAVEKISIPLNKIPAVNNEKLNELMAENWSCDIKKATTELNFQPKYNLKDGLIETLKWYKENNWL